jgi:FK506-binding protein 15
VQKVTVPSAQSSCPIASLITTEFAVFQVQANNYATFYDDQMQNWSVMFESSGDAVEFAREVSKTGIV